MSATSIELWRTTVTGAASVLSCSAVAGTSDQLPAVSVAVTTPFRANAPVIR